MKPQLEISDQNAFEFSRYFTRLLNNQMLSQGKKLPDPSQLKNNLYLAWQELEALQKSYFSNQSSQAEFAQALQAWKAQYLDETDWQRYMNARAQAHHKARKKDKSIQKIEISLTPELWAKLNSLAKSHQCTQQGAIHKMIEAVYQADLRQEPIKLTW